jgi:signal transduction histidine kinase/CheY-like chemotaxis protein
MLTDVITEGARNGPPVWLMVQDILDMPAPLARAVLRACHACYEDDRLRGRLGVAVSGEADFIALTYEATSPYRHAEKFLVSHLDLDTARKFFIKRRRSSLATPGQPGLDDDEESGFRFLYEQTGGSAHLIQEVVAAASRFPHPLDQNNPGGRWTRRATELCVQTFVNRSMRNDFTLLKSVREVERDIDAFQRLADITKRGDNEVELPGRMHPLEVLGFVRRTKEFKASFSSPMWRSYLTQRLDPTRHADVLARQGAWKQAWPIYEDLPPTTRDRPMTGDPRERLNAVLRDWGESLIAAAPSGTNEVCTQFFLGVKHLLGMDAAALRDGGASSPVPLRKLNFGRLTAAAFHPLLADYAKQTREIRLPFLPDEERLRLVSEPPTRYLHRQRLVGNPVLLLERRDEDRALDTADLHAVGNALDFFWRAFTVADHNEYQASLGDLRERHLKVIEHVNDLLNSSDDLGDVVQGAAQALIEKGGYYRTLICLVDPRREFIQAVAHGCHERENDFNLVTSFSLTDSLPEEEWDIQRWVVVKRQYVRVANAADQAQRSPRTQHEKVTALGMKGIAVVPMIVGDKVIGTIHFERRDRAEPTKLDCDLFQELATQIGVAIHQGQRFTLYYQSLMHLTDAVWIVDPQGTITFRNKAAAAAANDQPTQKKAPGSLLPAELEDTFPSRFLDPATEPGVERHYLFKPERRMASDLLTESILDFRHDLREKHGKHLAAANGRIGWVHRVHDLSALFELYDSLRSWVEGSDLHQTGRKIVEFFRQKGFDWCRLYVYRRNESEEWLESLEQFGTDESFAEEFAAGRLRFFRGKHHLAWHVLDHGEPAIYRHEEAAPEDGAPQVMASVEGKPRFKVHEPGYRQKLLKTDIEWIEAPLKVGEQTVGIVSLSFRSELPPIDWEILRTALLGMSMALYNTQQAERLYDFVSRMNHEIRTPLAWILGIAEELDVELRQKGIDPAHAQSIVKDSMNLRELIDHMVAFGLHKRGYGPYKPKPYAPRDLINEIGLKMSREAAAKGLRLKLETDDNVPQRITGDLLWTRSILVNLVGNAIKYTTQGSVTLRTTIDAGHIVYSVIDTGVGIKEDDRAQIFQLFQRGATAGIISPGWGVGLSETQQKVEWMSGRITHEENPGGGTAFVVRIPCEPADPPTQLAARRATRVSSGAVRILVVDDHARSREILSIKLKRLGFEVAEAESGKEAIAEASRFRPRVIFMDIAMPGLTGDMAAREIKARPGGQETLIVGLTANHAFAAERDRWSGAGFVDVLTQPADEATMLAWLETNAGIAFDYEQVATPLSVSDVKKALPFAEVSAIPLVERTKLRRAAQAGDTDSLREIATKLPPILRLPVEVLIEHFEHSTIISLFEPQP